MMIIIQKREAAVYLRGYAYSGQLCSVLLDLLLAGS